MTQSVIKELSNRVLEITLTQHEGCGRQMLTSALLSGPTLEPEEAYRIVEQIGREIVKHGGTLKNMRLE